ncbi:hypothetical protein EVAR_17890_1 [Eumeta japonica]|uniref:FLYWCH-type domain-containing protein n=1 Tax=Eumeta variegata TaxID=151549 RepID=A0A4C1UZL9_EUMVA|nr:hypothetical protein EVAR_17890_1 [Eumeta japonica]
MLSPFARNVKIIMSERGTQQIHLNGYSYSRRKRGCTVGRWYCTSHHSKGCRAFVRTVEDEIVCVRDQHTHPPRVNKWL